MDQEKNEKQMPVDLRDILEKIIDKLLPGKINQDDVEFGIMMRYCQKEGYDTNAYLKRYFQKRVEVEWLIRYQKT